MLSYTTYYINCQIIYSLLITITTKNGAINFRNKIQRYYATLKNLLLLFFSVYILKKHSIFNLIICITYMYVTIV